jgi:hypothetical protein
MKNLSKCIQTVNTKCIQTVSVHGVYGVNIQKPKNVSECEIARLRRMYGI